MLQAETCAQAIADSWRDQADHECDRQPEYHESGNKGDDAGGMLHVVISLQESKRVSVAERRDRPCSFIVGLLT